MLRVVAWENPLDVAVAEVWKNRPDRFFFLSVFFSAYIIPVR